MKFKKKITTKDSMKEKDWKMEFCFFKGTI